MLKIALVLLLATVVAAQLPVGQQSVTWRSVNDSVKPANRFDAAYDTTFDRSYTVMYGGVLEDWSIASDLWVLDHFTGEWSQILKQTNQTWPPALKDASGLFCGGFGNFYLFGGKTVGKKTSNQIWKYNLFTKQWTRLNENADSEQLDLAARSAHFSTCVLNSVIYIFGGSLSTGLLTDQLLTFSLIDYKLSIVTPSSTENISARSYAPIIYNLNDHHLYVFGGYAAGVPKGSNSNQLWKFNLFNKNWVRIPQDNSTTSWPSPRSGHNLFKLSPFAQTLVIFGGESLTGTGLNDMWSFNFNTAKWSSFSVSGETMPAGRLGSLMIQQSLFTPNKFLMFAGVSGWTNTKIFGDLWSASLNFRC